MTITQSTRPSYLLPAYAISVGDVISMMTIPVEFVADDDEGMINFFYTIDLGNGPILFPLLSLEPTDMVVVRVK